MFVPTLIKSDDFVLFFFFPNLVASVEKVNEALQIHQSRSEPRTISAQTFYNVFQTSFPACTVMYMKSLCERKLRMKIDHTNAGALRLYRPMSF